MSTDTKGIFYYRLILFIFLSLLYRPVKGACQLKETPYILGVLLSERDCANCHSIIDLVWNQLIDTGIIPSDRRLVLFESYRDVELPFIRQDLAFIRGGFQIMKDKIAYKKLCKICNLDGVNGGIFLLNKHLEIIGCWSLRERNIIEKLRPFF